MQLDASKTGWVLAWCRIEKCESLPEIPNGLFVCTAGIWRAEMKSGFANLVCNIRRFLDLERIKAS